jgi:hypothetical protein
MRNFLIYSQSYGAQECPSEAVSKLIVVGAPTVKQALECWRSYWKGLSKSWNSEEKYERVEVLNSCCLRLLMSLGVPTYKFEDTPKIPKAPKPRIPRCIRCNSILNVAGLCDECYRAPSVSFK